MKKNPWPKNSLGYALLELKYALLELMESIFETIKIDKFCKWLEEKLKRSK